MSVNAIPATTSYIWNSWKDDAQVHLLDKKNANPSHLRKRAQSQVVRPHAFRIVDKSGSIFDLNADQVKGWMQFRNEKPDYHYSAVYPIVSKNRDQIIFAMFIQAIEDQSDMFVFCHLDYDQTTKRSKNEISIEEHTSKVFLWYVQSQEEIYPIASENIKDRHLWESASEMYPFRINVSSSQPLCLTFHPKPFQIHVKLFTCVSITLDVTLDMTIENLFTKISEKIGNTKEGFSQFMMLFAGKQMQLGRTLKDYKILPGHTIIFNTKLRGGGGDGAFKLLRSADMTQTFLCDTTGRGWNSVSPGLNLQGTCDTENCSARGERVWMKYGFNPDEKPFNFNFLHYSAKCPCCGKFAKEVDNCGFVDCNVSIRGAYNLRGSVAHYVGEFQVPKDRLLTFDSVQKQEWHFIEVTVRKKEPSPSSWWCSIL